jgi:hypothetical protein
MPCIQVEVDNMLSRFVGLLLPALLSVAHASASVNASDLRVWIETASDGGQLQAQPWIESGHDALLSYELISIKTGEGGRSSSSQAGSVRVTGGETRSLTRLRLSIGEDDEYILSLRVYEGGELVGEDSVTFP